MEQFRGRRTLRGTARGSDLLFDINAGFSYISNAAGGSDNPERTSNAKRFNLDINFTQYSGGIRFDYGGFLHVNSMTFDMSELFGGPQSGSAQLPALGVHLQSTIPLGERIEIKPGAALSYHRNRYPVSLEPRFRFSWQPWGKEDQELHGAAGLYRQPIAGITDKRDAGSVFTAWLPVPVGESQMQAIHALLGWSQSWESGLKFSAEGYYKKLDTIPVPVWSTLARFTTDLAEAGGNVYGGDIRLGYKRPSWQLFAGYGYSWTQYKTSQEHFTSWFGSPSQRYHPIHDRRHQLNAQLNIDIGSYSLGARWQYGSGLPFTRPLGFDELLHFEEGVPNVKEEFGDPRVIHEKPYQGRMPQYHRLDVSIERTFDLPFAELNLQGGMINTYDRTNLFYYDVYRNARFDQLPLSPYVSLKLETR